jgi:hypothetical protein
LQPRLYNIRLFTSQKSDQFGHWADIESSFVQVKAMDRYTRSFYAVSHRPIAQKGDDVHIEPRSVS